MRLPELFVHVHFLHAQVHGAARAAVAARRMAAALHLQLQLDLLGTCRQTYLIVLTFDFCTYELYLIFSYAQPIRLLLISCKALIL